jgi:hypothetical protein
MREAQAKESANVRSVDEIVTDIMKTIADASPPPAQEDRVRRLIAALSNLKHYGPLNGNRADNKEFAERLLKWLDKGETLMRGSPKNFNFSMLFAPDPAVAESMVTIYEQADARYEMLAEILSAMHRRCEWIIKTGFGEHAHTGYQQERAAIAAGELMNECSLPHAYSSPLSPYRMVASLLYEAMTGEFGKDVERACEAMARKATATEK